MSNDMMLYVVIVIIIVVNAFLSTQHRTYVCIVSYIMYTVLDRRGLTDSELNAHRHKQKIKASANFRRHTILTQVSLSSFGMSDTVLNTEYDHVLTQRNHLQSANDA